jgi:IS6 family transposase
MSRSTTVATSADVPIRPAGALRALVNTPSRTDDGISDHHGVSMMPGAALLRWAPRRGAKQTDQMIGSTSGSSAPVGYRFPREVIAVAVRWYLRYGLSYRDVEELLAERGIEVDHVTVYRWVQTFTPAFIDAARPARHTTGNRWFVDETYVKVAGRWTYLYRAVDQHGQVIDVLLSTRRDAAAARTFFARALRLGLAPVEVTTDRAPVYPRVLDELVAARHVTEQYANNAIEADHGRLKARLRPMRGIKRLASVRTVATGHAFVQNLRRGHYAVTADLPVHDRLRVAFDELALSL